jgi:uncharacterized protein (TIGR02118 family)
MFKSLSFWRLKPGVNEEEAEKQYFEVHIPLAKKLPGLRKYTISKARGKDRKWYRSAELYYDDKDALNAAMSSPEGKSVIDDPGFHAFIEEMVVYYFDEEEVEL